MSQQLALIDTETAAAPMGLEYHPDFLAGSDEERLLAYIDNSEWLTDLSRRVLHFGYKYDYTSRSLDETARIGPLPEWLAQLSHKVREAASEEAKQLLDAHQPFEQAIVNEYEPKQGIAPHVDRDCFGPVVATVSLLFCRFAERAPPRRGTDAFVSVGVRSHAAGVMMELYLSKALRLQTERRLLRPPSGGRSCFGECTSATSTSLAVSKRRI